MQIVDFDQMARHISSLVSVPVGRLTPETTIAELTPDSFMFVEMAVDLQEEYDVVLTQHDLKDLHTLGDLASLLQRRQSSPDTELPDTEPGTGLGGQVPTAHAG